jgi:hypothetical protein
MRWISQQENPFEHNPKLACNVMQTIWNDIFPDAPHTIIQSGPVYGLASRNFMSYTLCVILHYRLYNTYLILGATPSARQRLLSSLLTAFPTQTCRTPMIIIKSLLNITLSISVFYTRNLTGMIPRCVLHFALLIESDNTPQKYRGAFCGPFIL